MVNDRLLGIISAVEICAELVSLMYFFLLHSVALALRSCLVIHWASYSKLSVNTAEEPIQLDYYLSKIDKYER